MFETEMRQTAAALIALATMPITTNDFDHGRDSLVKTSGEFEDDVFDVLEILIEGCWRGSDSTCNVDHTKIPHRLLVEQCEGRIENSSTGLLGAWPENPAGLIDEL
jgi:hypothetical protein